METHTPIHLSATMHIEFPSDLPINTRRAEIERLIAAYPVVVVCGETGSGKTTQLPKMALAMGRGRLNTVPGQPGRLIGHTQPRRIAASSVARRIAEELKTPLGEVVGYKVRFADRLSRTASIKLMTDGILLAETQSDPLLRAYDTIIIDEAHERSLNIDFLLGYLKQILPKRPDLKVIITSATIDAERFAQHFERDGVAAPVVMVSGRTWPVEQRWRPFEETREYGQKHAIADAVGELWRSPDVGGDVLVFLPGEREIRETADHLRKTLATDPALRDAEVLPLFSRLSPADQERVFAPHDRRRIVLATNVAETSLTVPGIHYVVDVGTARVKRYSLRSKVEQLLIEPISQAAANQRAGRCGRTAGGICIRLYDEDDFAKRPAFTDPEILRSSLAAVILRMKSLHLFDGDAEVADFPFLEPPSSRAIADGYRLLGELGAVDDAHHLTDLGQELSRLPLDPRIGRMILAAREQGALAEVLVIASALSVPDVRDRPLVSQAQADQKHAKFDDDKSEFSGYLKLWRWLHNARGGLVARSRREMAALEDSSTARDKPRRAPRNVAVLPAAQRAAYALQAAREALEQKPDGAAPMATHKLSNRQYEQLLREHFINVRRVREWRDTHSQLRTVVAQHRWQDNRQPASYEALHKALLTGLLGNVGCRRDDRDSRKSKRDVGEYLGANGIKFDRHPGAHLSKPPGRWVVCAELVQTARLFGRGMATIDPSWLESVAGHLLHKQVGDPHWEKKSGEVIAFERAALYGLPVYTGRRVHYGRIDPVAAREILIREGLMGGQWPEAWADALPFLKANEKLLARVRGMEHRSRRQDLLVDDELIFAFYDRQLPPDVVNGHGLLRWWRDVQDKTPKHLHLKREELMRHEAAGITTDAFPKLLRLGGVDCRATYLHAPGDAKDGLTVTVPIFALNPVSSDRIEWLVPGMLVEKVQALLKSLPQKPRSRLVPLPDSAAKAAQALGTEERFGYGGFLDELAVWACHATGLTITSHDFKLERLPPHLFMNLRVVDEHGRQLGAGRDLAALKSALGGQARGAFQALAALKTKSSKPLERSDSASKKSLPPRGGSHVAALSTRQTSDHDADQRYTDWTFGDWPELLEITSQGAVLIGFPALIDRGDAVSMTVFDEPEMALAQHRAGLRRLFALQLSDTLRYLDKNLPDWHAMAMAYMPLGTADELRSQIIDVALDRAFVLEPLPQNANDFHQRVTEGRARLTLIAAEVARLVGRVLAGYQTAIRKIKDSKRSPEAAQDATEQLQRLLPRDFVRVTPWEALQHFPRYLDAIATRMEKLGSNLERDREHMQAIRAQERRFWRLVAERQGVQDDRLQRIRWMLEELRVGLFAQELRTPQPISVKRLDKAWAQIRS